MGASAWGVPASSSRTSSTREFQPFLFHEVDAAERHHHPLDPEQAHDREVLARLRHGRLVRRHNQQHQVHPGRARQHVADEGLVARHVDHPEREIVAHREFGEPEVDGDAAPLLLGQAVRVHAGERLDESGLAVVDVPGCP